jgi:hypothetical protein
VTSAPIPAAIEGRDFPDSLLNAAQRARRKHQARVTPDLEGTLGIPGRTIANPQILSNSYQYIT